MAWHDNVNLGAYSSGNDPVFQLKDFLKNVLGWTIPWSNNQTLTNSWTNVDNIASSADLNGQYRGFVARSPDGLRAYLVVRGSQSYSWKCLFNRDETGNPLTSVGGNEPTSATAKGATNGTGTAAANVFPTSGSWYTHITGSDAEDPAGVGVYPFWAVSRVVGTGVAAHAFIYDSLMDGTRSAADQSPEFMLFTGLELFATYGAYLAYGAYATAPLVGWMLYNQTGAEWGTLYSRGLVDIYYTTEGAPISEPDNPMDVAAGIPICDLNLFKVVRRSGVAVGPKGYASNIRWNPTRARGFPYVYTVGADSWLLVDDLVLKHWPTGVVPAL